MNGRPLAVVAGVFSICAAVGTALAVDGRPVSIIAAAAALPAAWLLARGSRGTAAVAVAAALGLARASLLVLPVRDESFDAADAEREPLAIAGQVLESERARAGVRRVLLEIEQREARPHASLDPLRRPVRALISLRDSDDPAVLRRADRFVPRPGDRVRLLARIRGPPGQLNPGGPDRRRQLALRGIGYEGTASEDSLATLSRGPPWKRAAGELRDRFARRCADVCGSPERGALVAALAVGDRADLPADVDDELAASGLIHLLASAGLHVVALCAMVQWLAGKAWSVTPWAGRRPPRAVGALCALPFAAAEVALLGAPWPAMRAGLSAVLWLGARAGGRGGDSVTALAASAAVCALIDPGSLHDLPLQLSIAGVAGLLFLTGPIRELLPARRLPRPIEAAIRLGCATAAATLCTAPLLAGAFHRASIVGIVANAVALWPGLLAIPVATLAVPADLLSPSLSAPFFWAADLCALATLKAAAFFAALPGSRVTLATPGALAGAAWCAALLLFAGAPGPIGPGSSDRRHPLRLRLLRAAVPIAALLVFDAGSAAAARLSRTLSVTFLAVGQGDAAVVRLPGGRALLVDAGGDLFGGIPGRDPGTTRVLPALAELGISRLDIAVLTHPHPDHCGGLFAVLDRIPVGELWTTGEPGPGDLGDRLRRRARDRGVRLVEPVAGQHLDLDGVRIEVLHPRRWDPALDANDNSLVLRLIHGQVSILLAGDVEALAEAGLAQGAAPLDATLLKVPHHGSRTSSTEAFLRRVRPHHAVFCVGHRNPFGFPNADVVERYRQAGCRLWRTDRGSVTVESDGKNLRVRGPEG